MWRSVGTRLNELFFWLLSEEEHHHSYPPAPEGTVVYAIGDIHGRLDLLQDLGNRIAQDAEQSGKNSIEIYLGDYVDRGTASRQVIDWLLERKRTRSIQCLRGNHERILENFLAGTANLADWRPFGGVETLVSYGIDPEVLQDPLCDDEIRHALMTNFPTEHRDFLQSLQMKHEIGDYFFVHAGVRPDVPLDKQSESDCLWIRDEFLNYEGDFSRIVVHGHSAVQAPELLPNRINLDTGAYATGRLTCLKISGHGATLLPDAKR